MAGGLCLVLVFTVAVLSWRLGVKAATPSLVSCPQYVAEDETLACPCKTDDCGGRFTLSWVGLNPPSSVLVVQQVKRKDDGKRNTCQLICDGHTSTVDYTLRVAYGPYSDNMSVSGDLPFKTNGTQVLNLTCLATNVHPAPEYFWRSSHCGNDGNTCSFVPQREDHLKVETCWARNSGVALLQHSKNFTIDLQYTPPESPHIQRPRQILKAGDTLSCAVTGGKPLVQSVHFSCDNPYHPDRNDSINNASVTSYITIDTSQANDDYMTCHCSAYWAPEPSYYTNSSSASFRTEYSSTQGRSNPTFKEDDNDNDSGIDEKDSPPLDISASKPDSRPAQHHLDAGYINVGAARDGVRKKSARGQAYEVTSLVKGGGARIAGEITKPPATNYNGGHAEPWRDFNVDMPDGQPSVSKAPAHNTATPTGNNASADHYTGPRGEVYASVGEHGKGRNKEAASSMQTDKRGNKTSGKEMHSGAESTDARDSDTYDHFGRQGQQLRPYDPTYAHMQDF